MKRKKYPSNFCNCSFNCMLLIYSNCSNWFFLGQDLAIQTISMEMVISCVFFVFCHAINYLLTKLIEYQNCQDLGPIFPSTAIMLFCKRLLFQSQTIFSNNFHN